MNRLSRIALLFSVLFAVFIISPALLSKQFGPYPLMRTGDIVDIFTPLILIPIYWILFQLATEAHQRRAKLWSLRFSRCFG